MPQSTISACSRDNRLKASCRHHSPSRRPDALCRLRPLPNLIFMSRWLQLPLYLGLIVAQGVYVCHFWVELVHL